MQNAHPGTIQLEGDTALGRSYVSELMHGRGGSHLNYSVYHDRYRRTADGWRFTERVYEVRYVDTTPLAGSSGAHRVVENDPPAAVRLAARDDRSAA